MKNRVLASAVMALLAACGGGGGDSGTTTAPTPPAAPAPPPPQTEQLAGYIGNWAADCKDHAIETLAVSRTAGTINSINLAFKSDYYVNADCTGNIVGTWTQSAGVTAVHVDTVDSAITFTIGSNPVASRVDRVAVSQPQHTNSVTGTGVTRMVLNGVAQWCINYGNNTATCIRDEGTYPATSGGSAGLYVQGNDMYELTPSGMRFVVSTHYRKK
jgi:hypothetical protein